MWAGFLQERGGLLLRTQGGVYKDDSANANIFYVTLDKDPKHFTPTTLYNDYPISPTRFHWETQGVTREDSETGRRYRGVHPKKDWPRKRRKVKAVARRKNRATDCRLPVSYECTPVSARYCLWIEFDTFNLMCLAM